MAGSTTEWVQLCARVVCSDHGTSNHTTRLNGNLVAVSYGHLGAVKFHYHSIKVFQAVPQAFQNLTGPSKAIWKSKPGYL